jgi:hypothetical protein
MNIKNQFDLVIFDWAGTMVDFGCQAPVIALIEAFAAEGVAIDEAAARRDMGVAKDRSRARSAARALDCGRVGCAAWRPSGRSRGGSAALAPGAVDARAGRARLDVDSGRPRVL